MTTAKKNSVSKSARRTVVVTRVLPAPAEIVFDAWLDPAAAGRWLFATPGGKMLRVEIDARVGGAFTIIEQRAKMAAEHLGTYLEIDRPRRLVFNFSCPQISAEFTKVTVEIKSGGSSCALTLTHENVFADYHDRVTDGWNLILEKLVATVSAGREMVISRVFAAPRELVWEAWTNPKHVAQWWGPNGFSTTIEKMDVKPGGVWKQIMHGPDGTNYPSKSVFSEVVKPARIVFIHGGSKKGGSAVHFVSTWTFAEKGKKTEVTIRMVFATAAECDLIAHTYGALEGGKQTLARLAEFLEKTKSR